jgi:hypothetical protein
MIIYDLVCDQDHRFEGWFASAAEFDRQSRERLVECPLCGSSDTRRVASAAYVHTSSSAPQSENLPERSEAVYEPGTDRELPTQVLAKMVRHILEKSDDVGSEFPEEARRIHYRETPERMIRGTASKEEFEELREEGIPVSTLPFSLPGRGKSH